MEIPKTYEPQSAEAKWYKHWLDKGYFHSTPDEREPYTIVIPPPNVTGVLHMGHMLNNTIQDVLVRRARMLGKNACWIPGTDHASIATEAKVVQKLRAEGIKKSDLTRDEFLKHAFEWKEKHGGIILEQLKKLGASCDWERTAFTMDSEYSESVIGVFIDLYKKGKIYRGVRMVNWDPEAKTALSDEEVIHKEVNSKLFHLRYKIADGNDEWLVIATTRPETILGDTAICINPNDERYKHLHGKQAIVPIANRTIPIILDEYVDMEFGTGCLKVTPAHDVNDYDLGVRHHLETIDILNDNGTLNEHGLHYAGQDRFDVRKAIEKELYDKGYLVKTEDHINKVGFSERTNAPYMPFIAEELWHLIRERKEGDDIVIAAWPTIGAINQTVLDNFKRMEEVITGIRNIRKSNNIANKVKVDLLIGKNNDFDTSFDSVVIKMGNLSSLEYTSGKVANANSFIVANNEYYIPFGDSIDVEAEKTKLEEELKYTKGFLASVQGKLRNEKFVSGAPVQVVETERKKEADALSKISILEEKLAMLN
ncbi:tRNA ligase class I [Ancylostoma ceylanicum]|uniref:Valine--tRNA ligase n=1 Tax=Ancylostoma ceylanicum TaxID=53326 RepID=A0A0D6LD65_9BILA|nr:tRNA ligase class I [Ancylostoma ceylanicum]